MFKKQHRWLFNAMVTVMLVAVTATEAQAGAWSDYVEAATSIVADDNRLLNAALRPTEKAEVKVLVEVRQTGVISESKVIESSGNEALDAATLAAIEKLASLPTPPASVYFKQFFTPLVFTYSFDPGVVSTLQKKPVSVVQSDKTTGLEEVNEPTPAEPDKTVLALQTALIEAGFDPGPVDGFYGTGTANAIRFFQRDRGLTVDGVPTAALLQVMAEEAKPRQVQAAAEPESDASESDASESDASESDAPESDALGSEQEVVEDGFTPPETGVFSLNREIYEDYEYVGDRHIEDY